MVSFRLLHSHLKVLSNNDLKGTRIERGFKRAFAKLSDQDVQTFPGIMFLNVDQLEKQHDKEEFQVIGSMAAFRVLKTQFHTDTLIQYMKSFKKSIDERALHKRVYDSRVNERQMQTKEGKVDMSRALGDSLVDTENIKPVYDEEPMVEVQLTVDNNVFATRQHHTKQPEFNNEGEVDQDAEQYHDIRPLPAISTDNQITELSNQYLESENTCLEKTVS
ncbi:hypothetical protein Tco_0180118 [Tanacetum coccineum]